MSDYADDFEEVESPVDVVSPKHDPATGTGPISAEAAANHMTPTLDVSLSASKVADARVCPSAGTPPAASHSEASGTKVASFPTENNRDEGHQQMKESEMQTEHLRCASEIDRADRIVIGGTLYDAATLRRGVTSSRGSRPNLYQNTVTARPSSRGVTHVSSELSKIRLLRESRGEAAHRPIGGPSSAGVEEGLLGASRPMSSFAGGGSITHRSAVDLALSPDSLCNAACSGDVTSLKKLVAHHIIVVGADAYSLVNAAGFVTLNRVRYGLKRSGSTFTIGLGGKATPLQFAAVFGQTSAAKYLLDAGASDAAFGGLPAPSTIAGANGFSSLKSLLGAHVRKASRPSAAAPARAALAREAASRRSSIERAQPPPNATDTKPDDEAAPTDACAPSLQPVCQITLSEQPPPELIAVAPAADAASAASPVLAPEQIVKHDSTAVADVVASDLSAVVASPSAALSSSSSDDFESESDKAD